MFKESDTQYGLVIVQGEESLFYSIDTFSRYKYLGKVRKKIANNHRRGGQSQARIGRLRDEQIHQYISLVEERITRYYTKDGVVRVKQVILSGSGQKKEQVRDRIISRMPVSLLSYSSLQDVMTAFPTITGKDKVEQDKKTIQEIEDYLRVDPDRLVFSGETKAEIRNLEKIWIRKENILEDLQKEMTGKVVVLDHYFLDSYGGVIGLLWK